MPRLRQEVEVFVGRFSELLLAQVVRRSNAFKGPPDSPPVQGSDEAVATESANVRAGARRSASAPGVTGPLTLASLGHPGALSVRGTRCDANCAGDHVHRSLRTGCFGMSPTGFNLQHQRCEIGVITSRHRCSIPFWLLISGSCPCSPQGELSTDDWADPPFPRQ